MRLNNSWRFRTRKYIYGLLLIFNLQGLAFAGQKCGLIEQVCASGPETRIFDGMAVYRPCWEYKTKYACIQDKVDTTCDSPIGRGCSQSTSSCVQGVTINGVFQCITENVEYVCKVANGSSSSVSDCTTQQFCIDGNCFDTGSVPDPDFAQAVTGMETLREAGVYVDESTFQLFKGLDNRCSKNVLQNCCKGSNSKASGLSNLAIAGGSAYAFDVLSGGGLKSSIVFGFDPTTFALGVAVLVVQELLKCDKEEVLLNVKRDHRLCHYVGEYCSKRINLVFTKICVQHKETFCCYNSKIARIINEAARTQLSGLSWGGPQDPACNGLTIPQFQSLDFSQIDFSEFYADIQPKGANVPNVVDQAKNKVNSYFNGP